ncbi:unnamed protein product [Ectocarpus sp. 12 AP-2014]
METPRDQTARHSPWAGRQTTAVTWIGHLPTHGTAEERMAPAGPSLCPPSRVISSIRALCCSAARKTPPHALPPYFLCATKVCARDHCSSNAHYYVRLTRWQQPGYQLARGVRCSRYSPLPP